MLIRFDPFREVDRLMGQLAAAPAQALRSFPMDAFRRGEQVIVQLDLPGVDPGSIDVTSERNVVSIRAERRFERQEGDDVLVAERPHGTFARQLSLGENFDAEALQASYDQGVLTITVPIAQQAKPRRIEVSAGGQPQTIEGTGTEARTGSAGSGGEGGSPPPTPGTPA